MTREAQGRRNSPPCSNQPGKRRTFGLPRLADVLGQRGQFVEIDGDRRFRPFEEALHAGRGRQEVFQNVVKAVQDIEMPALDADLAELFLPGLEERLAPHLDLRRAMRLAGAGTQQSLDQHVPGLGHRGLIVAGLEREDGILRAVPQYQRPGRPICFAVGL